jgi:hypothetical protein
MFAVELCCSTIIHPIASAIAHISADCIRISSINPALRQVLLAFLQDNKLEKLDTLLKIDQYQAYCNLEKVYELSCRVDCPSSSDDLKHYLRQAEQSAMRACKAGQGLSLKDEGTAAYWLVFIETFLTQTTGTTTTTLVDQIGQRYFRRIDQMILDRHGEYSIKNAIQWENLRIQASECLDMINYHIRKLNTEEGVWASHLKEAGTTEWQIKWHADLSQSERYALLLPIVSLPAILWARFNPANWENEIYRRYSYYKSQVGRIKRDLEKANDKFKTIGVTSTSSNPNDYGSLSNNHIYATIIQLRKQALINWEKLKC